MWPNPQETADLVTFTEEILNGKLHFLCSDNINSSIHILHVRLYPRFFNFSISRSAGMAKRTFPTLNWANIFPSLVPLHKKWSFPLEISSVIVTKSTVSCGFRHIYWRNLQELHFLCSVHTVADIKI